jgi:hypothetical protein
MKIGLESGSMPRLCATPIWCREFESVCMDVIADGSGDGITLPLPASLARDAPFVKRPRDGCRRHPIVFNLPGHAVNDVLVKPIRNEHSIAIDIPPKDRFRELSGNSPCLNHQTINLCALKVFSFFLTVPIT